MSNKGHFETSLQAYYVDMKDCEQNIGGKECQADFIPVELLIVPGTTKNKLVKIEALSLLQIISGFGIQEKSQIQRFF